MKTIKPHLKKSSSVLLIIFLISILLGCQASNTAKGTAIGAGTGGVIGGVIGRQSNNTAVGAIISSGGRCHRSDNWTSHG